MKKWYDEEYEFQVEVIGHLRGDHTEHLCRNGEEIGDTYRCTYGCPVNADGYGICSKTMMTLYPLMEAVRSGGDMKISGRREVQQDYRVSGRLRDVPADRKASGRREFLQRRLLERAVNLMRR